MAAGRDLDSQEVKVRYRKRPSPPKPLNVDSLSNKDVGSPLFRRKAGSALLSNMQRGLKILLTKKQ